MEQETNTTQDLLDVYEPNVTRADTGKRLGNYIIDLVVFYIFAIGIAVVIAIISPSTINSMDSDDPGFALIDKLVSLILYALFLGIQEAAFKGKTIGKFITATRAVYLDGSTISTKTAFLRGFSRAVPFCVFSALGTPCNPWQDRWTDTLVMDEKKSQHI